jgi:lysophospholipase L1-like esterase
VVRSKERWFRVVAVACGVLAGLFLCELALRAYAIFHPGSFTVADVEWSRTIFPPPFDGSCAGKLGASLGALIWPSAHPGVVYELRPGLDTCFVNVRVQTGPDGLRRGSNLTGAKSAGTFRILLLGDSQAFGWGVSFEDTVGILLQREFAMAGRGVEVLNAGVPGYNAAQEAAYFATIGAAFRPDCALVLFMGNDFDPPPFRVKADATRSPRSFLGAAVPRAWRRWQSPSPVDDQPLEVLAFAPSMGPSEADLAQLPPEYRDMVGLAGYRRALVSLAGTAESLRVPVVNFADYSYLMPEDQATELVRYQRSLGVAHPDFRFPRGSQFRLSDDDPHLNARGHGALARRMAAGLHALGVFPSWNGGP